MIKIHGIPFKINWGKFLPYSSFFIPCLDTKNATATVRKVCVKKKYKVRIKTVVENKIRGIRVWRLK